MSRDADDHETKYLLAPATVPATRVFLAATCSPETPFDGGWIDSIYFDTPHLLSLQEKLSSQLFKTKLRLRWYDDRGPVFAEIKRRRGERREKFRLELKLRGEDLVGAGVAPGLLRDVTALLARQGVPLPQELRPVVRVRFRRWRWREPATGARLALDTDIRAVARAATLGGGVSAPLDLGVVELKGAATRLPVRLWPLAGFGCRRSSFSKYSACMGATKTGWIAT
jgi:VTC domain